MKLKISWWVPSWSSVVGEGGSGATGLYCLEVDGCPGSVNLCVSLDGGAYVS